MRHGFCDAPAIPGDGFDALGACSRGRIRVSSFASILPKRTELEMISRSLRGVLAMNPVLERVKREHNQVL
jgi:hypothetical protein